MKRLTERIKRLQKDDLIVYTNGKYEDTIPAEMTNDDIRAVLKKLADYEDLEEHGLLVRLPVKIETELLQPCADRKSIIRSIVINNTITDDDIYIGIIDERGNERHYSKKSIGKTVFLTREEAEKKLEEMKK